MAGQLDKNGRMTPKMLAFCRAYVETGNQSEAYRRAYDTKNMKPNSVTKMASDLMKDPRVASMTTSMQAEVNAEARKAQVAATREIGLTREWIIERLMRNADLGFVEGMKPEGPTSNKALELLGKVDSIALFEERINQTGEVFVIAAPAEDEETDVEGWAQGHRGVAP